MARALHRLAREVGDSMAFVAYHFNSATQTDPFTIHKNGVRAQYYNISRIPATWMDGTVNRRGVQSYSTYRTDFNTRKTISAPLQIEFTGSYNPGTRQGNVNAHVTNTSDSTISGKIHFILTETDIAYSWHTEDSVFHVVRDILPDGHGEAVTINPGATIVKSRNFTVSASWSANKCDIIAFVQGANKEIYQGAKIHIMNIAVEEGEKITESRLRIYPNPFTTKTVIRVQGLGISRATNLSGEEAIKLQIYDLSGRVVKSFSLPTNPLPLTTAVVWDGRDDSGVDVASGIYFCTLITSEIKLIEKLISLRR